MKKNYKNLFVSTALLLGAGSLHAQCDFTLEKYDSYGDGWNGNQLEISINGTPTIYTLGGGSFGTDIITVNDNDLIEVNYLAGGDWNFEVSFTLLNNVGQVLFASPQGPSTGLLYTGDAECITCGAPSNITSTFIDNQQIDVEWDPSIIGAISYELEWGPSGFTPGSGNIETGITGTTFSIVGLDQVTDYDVYVFTDCGIDSSNVVGPATFTTLPNCSALTNFVATVNAPDEVELAWTLGSTGETEWYVEYGAPGFTFGTGTGLSVTPNPTTVISGLTQNTTYSFYVRGVCSTVDSSLWVGPETVTTPLFCNNVSGLSATTVVDTAFLSWTAGIDGETEWNVEYGPFGFTLGTGTMYTTSQNNTDTLVGLNPSSTYQFYVQAACASGDTSLFTGPFTFSTPLGNDDACDAIDLPVDGIDRFFNNNGATATESGTIIIPNSDCTDNTGWCLNTNITNSVWFSIAAPASGNIIVSSTATGEDGQLAFFSASDCSDYSTFDLIAANDDANDNTFAPELSACGLTPGETYYIMYDPWSSGDFHTFAVKVTEVSVFAGNDASVSICATENDYDLSTGISGQDLGGNWDFNFNPNAISGSIFNATVLPINTYEVAYSVQEGCAVDTSILSVSLVATPQSGTAVSPFVTCNTDNVFLPDGLSGTIQSGGTWSDDSGTGLLGGANGNIFVANDVPEGSYSFTYTVSGGVCPDASTTVNVNLANCVGVDENSLDFSIFPNPNNGTFNLVSNISEKTEITVMDVQGKIVYNNVVTLAAGIANEININNVETGMYIIRITSNHNTATSTFVVQ